ncbi:hypothetical protein FN846DRAFT_893039 [Sphaerosporella brunnea]|uniref:Uncharacterized protein n=1 Tax=Sphaerosporella brunnea TaxID=1250544 RepID=A0A5J5ENN9_9PEZI|nr:hypothetical protein FN846DRAFT_893039 [Sphaerosporella brunnea]
MPAFIGIFASITRMFAWDPSNPSLAFADTTSPTSTLYPSSTVGSCTGSPKYFTAVSTPTDPSSPTEHLSTPGKNGEHDTLSGLDTSTRSEKRRHDDDSTSPSGSPPKKPKWESIFGGPIQPTPPRLPTPRPRPWRDPSAIVGPRSFHSVAEYGNHTPDIKRLQRLLEINARVQDQFGEIRILLPFDYAPHDTKYDREWLENAVREAEERLVMRKRKRREEGIKKVEARKRRREAI